MSSVPKPATALLGFGVAGIGVFSTYKDWPEPIRSSATKYATACWVALLGTTALGGALFVGAFVAALGIGVIWPDLRLQTRVARTTDLKAVHALATRLFGPGVSSINRMKSWSHASKRAIILIESIRDTTKKIVGYFCLLPLSDAALVDLIDGNLTGAHIESHHLATGQCAAIYLGAVGADGIRARQAALDALNMELRSQVLQLNASRIFTRPVTKRGFELAKTYGFTGLAGAPLRLNELAFMHAALFRGGDDETSAAHGPPPVGQLPPGLTAANPAGARPQRQRPIVLTPAEPKKLQFALTLGGTAAAGIVGLLAGSIFVRSSIDLPQPPPGPSSSSSTGPKQPAPDAGPPPGSLARLVLNAQRTEQALPSGRHAYYFWVDAPKDQLREIENVEITAFEHDHSRMNGPVAWARCGGSPWKVIGNGANARVCDGSLFQNGCECRFVLLSELCPMKTRLSMSLASGLHFERTFSTCRLLNENRSTIRPTGYQLQLDLAQNGTWSTQEVTSTTSNTCAGSACQPFIDSG